MCENIIIKNVKIIHPWNGINETKQESKREDLYIADGIITDSDQVKDSQKTTVIDGTNLYAAPGFIDMHVHVFEDYTSLGIRADKVGVEQGVLRVVDAGSTGIRDFSIFKKAVIDKNKTDVFYFLNIARIGLVDCLSELSDETNLMTGDELNNFIKESGSNLVGLKVRMSSSVVKDNGLNPLIHARELSDKTGLPLMIHIGNAPPSLGNVLNLLKKGDIVTHVFHGKEGGIPYFPKEFKEAAERGVQFDVGHGNASFSYPTVQKVMDIKPIDFSISTDIYKANYKTPVESLMTTMSKFTDMKMPLEQLIYKVTELPGKMLNLPVHKIVIGKSADITLFQLIKQKKEYVDSEGITFEAAQYLKPMGAIKKGKVMWKDYV